MHCELCINWNCKVTKKKCLMQEKVGVYNKKSLFFCVLRTNKGEEIKGNKEFVIKRDKNQTCLSYAGHKRIFLISEYKVKLV